MLSSWSPLVTGLVYNYRSHSTDHMYRSLCWRYKNKQDSVPSIGDDAFALFRARRHYLP